MAKKRGKSFGDKLARQLKLSMGPWWSDEGIQAINQIAVQAGEDASGVDFGHLVLQPCLTFQHEMAVRDFDEEGKDFDDLSPFVYPELMRAWEHCSVCVELSEGATEVAFNSEDGYIQDVPLAGLTEFFPGCMCLDVRKLGVSLYNISVDAVFVYPSYNSAGGHVALMFVGVNQGLGFTFAYEARLVLRGRTFGDAARETNRVLDQERSLCLGGMAGAPSEEFFSALDSEPELFAVTWRLLAALCSERVELVRQTWGRGETIKARAKKPESEQVVEGVHLGDAAGGQSEPAGGVQADAPLPDVAAEGSLQHAGAGGLGRGESIEHVDLATCADEGCDCLEAEPQAAKTDEDELQLELLRVQVEQLADQLARQKAADAFRAKQLEDELSAQRARADALQARAQLMEAMDIPQTPLEALQLAERAFADRIIVLPRARKSAEEFVKGDPGEVWAVLRSIAVTLYSLLFCERERGLANAFRDRTGYELALRDAKGANRNAAQKAERMVEYEGGMRDATMHIKGRGTKRGESLRVHFFVDYEKGKVVIVHCGEHLTTDRTSSL